MPERRKPADRPLIETGNLTSVVVLTICTKNRKPILARDDVHSLLVDLWKNPANHWTVGRYVLLPDHIHLFCAPALVNALGVRPWSRFWKSAATKRWPRAEEKPVWQLDVWDRQLRNGETYEEKWEYVRENPVRHGLVDAPEKWPYQGEIERLEWHDA